MFNDVRLLSSTSEVRAGARRPAFAPGCGKVPQPADKAEKKEVVYDVQLGKQSVISRATP